MFDARRGESVAGSDSANGVESTVTGISITPWEPPALGRQLVVSFPETVPTVAQLGCALMRWACLRRWVMDQRARWPGDLPCSEMRTPTSGTGSRTSVRHLGVCETGRQQVE